uniref:hypothetical protein n=1 Tax=Pseudolysinimonas sp. TaxID=2680009 RepID=UPI00286C7D59
LMLIYLLGDVLRIFAGHFTPGRMAGREAAGWMWTVAALVMLLPIVMILVSLLVPATPLVWITVIVAAFLVLFNLVGLPYEGFYDNMLIVVGIVVNGITIWQALAWRPEAVS